MADSSDIDQALIAKLGADGTLLASVPNGVYWDEAPVNMTAFVIVSLVDEHDDPMFSGRAFENGIYLVKAVVKGAGSTAVKAAAARIDVLLEQGTLTVSGYGPVMMRRQSRVRYTEVDDGDASIRWQHRGGRYEVVVSTS